MPLRRSSSTTAKRLAFSGRPHCENRSATRYSPSRLPCSCSFSGTSFVCSARDVFGFSHGAGGVPVRCSFQRWPSWRSVDVCDRVLDDSVHAVLASKSAVVTLFDWYPSTGTLRLVPFDWYPSTGTGDEKCSFFLTVCTVRLEHPGRLDIRHLRPRLHSATNAPDYFTGTFGELP